jgi:hypothetical protein
MQPLVETNYGRALQSRIAKVDSLMPERFYIEFLPWGINKLMCFTVPFLASYRAQMHQKERLR